MNYRIINYLAILLLLSQCATPIENCTDPIAQNYDASADKNCCCTYYQLRLALNHQWNDSTSFAYNNPFTDVNGDTFEIQDIQLYISDAHLVDVQGNTAEVYDSIFLIQNNGVSDWYTDDFALMSAGVLNLDLGDFFSLGTYNQLKFAVGLSPEVRQTDPNQVSDTEHSLYTDNALYDATNSTYYLGKLQFIVPSQLDTFDVFLTDSLQVQLDTTIISVDGANTSIALDVNYEKLLNGVTVSSTNISNMATQLKANLNNLFSLQ
ncbi:MAG: hypothetical protein MK212_04960 [Saprospiraceae bacterium]|nr:hypothetical protein [Saprospiraceae bacterium]